MKHINKYILLIVLSLSLFNCSDDFFDVNTPSNAAEENQLRMADLIAPAQYYTFQNQYWAERSLGNYTQYFTGQSGDAVGAVSLPGAWSSFYLHVLPNLNIILSKAEENNATHFGAVAKIIIASNMGLLTDSWENVPYSEAGQYIENLQPGFDVQEDIYNDIFVLLDEAIAALEAEDNSGFSIKNDMIYGGDASKWLRAAYTFKARYQMHLTKKNGIAAAAAALISLENGFTSNDDDFQMTYPGDIKNPWHIREVLAPNTSNDHDKIGDQLVSYMNGTSYPFATILLDPRLPVYADKNADDASDPWRGYLSGGDGLSSDGENGNTNFADEGFYTLETSPIVLLSYAEALFLKAEAEFLVNGGDETSIGTSGNAYDAYLAGIGANMNKLNVDGADYLSDTSILLDAGSLMLQHIMKEKYIANFLNPETYVDFRRYSFSTDVFKDLSLPEDNASSEFPGEWLVRAQYPASEETRNPDNVNANKKAPTVPVWWDE